MNRVNNNRGITAIVGLGVGGLFLTACANSGVQGEADPGFQWKEIGQNERGCFEYTKVPLRDEVIVDAAVWYYLPDQGRFVINSDECVPGARFEQEEKNNE